MLEMNNIYKNYGKTQILKGVNIKVNKGDIYGLVGKNGAGKTTIFKIILGLTSYEDGTLSINGSKKPEELKNGRRKTGFFIGHNFFEYMTARENLEYYRMMKGIKDKNEVDRVLKIVDLDKTDKKYSNFSLGMKQRLGIANAILGNPEFLILDEPTNGLDPQGIADIRNLVIKLNEEYGMTVIISSHILGELEHTAKRFGIVHNGVIVNELEREDLKKDNDIVQIKVSDKEKVERILKENGIEIIESTIASKSLENYYFEMVGGSKNA